MTTDDDDNDLRSYIPSHRTAEDDRLDALAMSVSEFLDGQAIVDVARVCAGLAAAAIAMEYPTSEKRHKNLERLMQFMRNTLRNIEETERSTLQ